jgi:hypothetical protein
MRKGIGVWMAIGTGDLTGQMGMVRAYSTLGYGKERRNQVALIIAIGTIETYGFLNSSLVTNSLVCFCRPSPRATLKSRTIASS